MTSNEIEPRNIAVTPSSGDYLAQLVEYALLEGEPGQQEIKGSAQGVLEALHHVLGGGTVSINIETPGNVTVVEELNTLLGSARDEWNRLPRDAGIFWF
jgi:hypothetical protein